MKKTVSVILPAYNAELYIRESIESVIAQSNIRLDDVELIIINDGSSDNTISIIEEYEQKYPNIIKVYNQKNSGVSATRNKGLDCAVGEYIAFIDADDQWSKNFLSESLAFLRDTSVDLVASKILFFDNNINPHHTNYKFKKTRIINVDEDPDNPIMHVSTCVYRRESIGGTRFDTGLSVTEDSKFLSEIIHKKHAYGVMSRTAYYYRKRGDDTSAIGGQHKNRDFYLMTPVHAYMEMLDTWTNEHGEVAAFMQYTILSDIIWRLRQREQSVLTDVEESIYKQHIHSIIERISDEVICSRRGFSVEDRLIVLKLKYNVDVVEKAISFNNDGVYYKNYRLCSANDISAKIDFITPTGDGEYRVEGVISPSSEEIVRLLRLYTKGNSFQVRSVQREQLNKEFLGSKLTRGGAFESTITTQLKDTLRVCVGGVEDHPLRLLVGNFVGVSQLSLSFCRKDETLIQKYRRSITFTPYTKMAVVLREVAYTLRLLGYWRLTDGLRQLKELRKRNLEQLTTKARVFEILKPAFIVFETVVLIPRAIILRLAYWLRRVFQAKPIWIISDRAMAAGDNGEALFRYIMQCKDVPAAVYFAISKKSKDYNRIKSIGPTLNWQSLRYKLYFLLSDKVISSHADVEVTNPFIRQINQYVDLFSFDFIFLQHGITKDDISSWLNRYEKNIKLFITAGVPEYESILSPSYHYNRREVCLTGFPRYDLLENSPQRKLIIAPTYRAGLLKNNTNAAGTRPYDNAFKFSEYFNFYNRLMNDKRVIMSLKKNNMTAELYIHPNFAAQADDFTTNSHVSVAPYPHNYRKAFSEGSLLLTDYSSVAFDFAYLRKPVIYTQYDADEFFSQHSYSKGYFSYEEDGFGPVCKDYEHAVQTVVAALDGDTHLIYPYTDRIDNFFKYNDRQNSQRVYNAIISH